METEVQRIKEGKKESLQYCECRYPSGENKEQENHCDDKMDHLNEILRPYIKASKTRLSYVDELFPDLKDNPYIILHKNVSIM